MIVVIFSICRLCEALARSCDRINFHIVIVVTEICSVDDQGELCLKRLHFFSVFNIIVAIVSSIV